MTAPNPVSAGAFDEGVEPFTLDKARWRRGRLTPRSNFKLQALAAYPALYREVNQAESVIQFVEAPAADDGRATRILNVAVAAMLLLLTAPLFILIAIAIKITTRGPVFYSQTRVGLDRRTGPNAGFHEARKHDIGGKPFKMYKFRTMYINAEANG